MPLDASEQKVIDNIKRYGWHCMLVCPRIDDPDHPHFAYTIGLQKTYDLPEMICFGADTRNLHIMLANAVDELRAGEMKPVEGLVLTEVLEKYPCRLRKASAAHFQDHLGWAMWFAMHEGKNPMEIECYQLLWPDKDGHFPDESACAEGVRELQPLLWASA